MDNLKKSLTRFSFGSVAAIITNTALIITLYQNNNSKYLIVGSLLVIALADNISDSFGIHIYQEGTTVSYREVWYSTFFNFLARLLTSLVFILIVIFCSITLAKILAIFYGLLILIMISYIIARKRKVSPKKIILEHIIIAAVVIFASRILSIYISIFFRR